MADPLVYLCDVCQKAMTDDQHWTRYAIDGTVMYAYHHECLSAVLHFVGRQMVREESR